jgi:hypothetical protein
MTFDSYPRDVPVLRLQPAQASDELAITPLLFGPDNSMNIRLVRLTTGTGAPPPAPSLELSAAAGPMTVIPPTDVASDLEAQGGAIVATARYKHESNEVYLIRIFPEVAGSQPQIALRLTNSDTVARSFRWVVADVLAETAQARVELPPAQVDTVAAGPVTGQIEVRNIGTGELRLTADAGTDLGAGFTLSEAPSPVPANRVGQMKISYKPPSLSPGVVAIVTTTHRFTTNDSIAQQPGRTDARATITANVLGPRWQPGDVLVVDPQASDGSVSRALVRIDPATGRQAVVSAGQKLVSPAGVALEPTGHALVVDSGAEGGNGAVIRVDRFSGSQTILSSQGFFRDPSSVVVTPQGRIVVADPRAFDGVGGLITVDPNGVQTKLASGGPLFRPFDLAVDDPATGSLVALNTFQAGTPRLVRVEPNGVAAAFTVDAGMRCLGIEVDATRRVLLAFGSTAEGPVMLVAYRPNGTQDIVPNGHEVGQPFRLRRDAAGNVLVTDQKMGGGASGLRRFPLGGGEQRLLSQGGVLRSPLGLAVVPPFPG